MVFSASREGPAGVHWLWSGMYPDVFLPLSSLCVLWCVSCSSVELVVLHSISQHATRTECQQGLCHINVRSTSVRKYIRILKIFVWLLNIPVLTLLCPSPWKQMHVPELVWFVIYWPVSMVVLHITKSIYKDVEPSCLSICWMLSMMSRMLYCPAASYLPSEVKRFTKSTVWFASRFLVGFTFLRVFSAFVTLEMPQISMKYIT